MAEEAFLRSIVPAVSTARHGLAKFSFGDDVNEPFTGVMRTLVAVDHRLFAQLDLMVLHQISDCIENEIDLRLSLIR